MSDPFTSDDLQDFIVRNRIEATILPMAGHTPTVSDAARELGVETEHIVKSLVFMNDGHPLLVVTNGLARVDRRKLAAYVGVGRKKVKFASAEQALGLTGFVVGSMPPFGHRETLRTVVDPSVTQLDTIYGGGGDLNAMMRLTPRELVRVTGAEIQDLSEDGRREGG